MKRNLIISDIKKLKSLLLSPGVFCFWGISLLLLLSQNPPRPLIYSEVLFLKNFKARFPTPALPRGDFAALFLSQ